MFDGKMVRQLTFNAVRFFKGALLAREPPWRLDHGSVLQTPPARL